MTVVHAPVFWPSASIVRARAESRSARSRRLSPARARGAAAAGVAGARSGSADIICIKSVTRATCDCGADQRRGLAPVLRCVPPVRSSLRSGLRPSSRGRPSPPDRPASDRQKDVRSVRRHRDQACGFTSPGSFTSFRNRFLPDSGILQTSPAPAGTFRRRPVREHPAAVDLHRHGVGGRPHRQRDRRGFQSPR